MMDIDILLEKYNGYKNSYDGKFGRQVIENISHPHLFGLYAVMYPNGESESINSLVSMESENKIIDMSNKRNNTDKPHVEANCSLKEVVLEDGIILTYLESLRDIKGGEYLYYSSEEHRNLKIIAKELKAKEDMKARFGTLSESTNINNEDKLSIFEVKTLLKDAVTSLYEYIDGKEKDDVEPVFIMLTKTDNIISKTIRNFTGDPYSHVSISFDYKMDGLYSFSVDPTTNKLLSKGGLRREDVNDKFFKDVNSQYSLYVSFMQKGLVTNMKKKLETMLSNINKFKFNKLGLVLNGFGIETEFDGSYFCSEFVTDILNSSGAEIIYQHKSRIRPYDFAKMKAFHFLDKGKTSKYNSDRVKKKLDSLFDNIYGTDKSLKEYIELIIRDEE